MCCVAIYELISMIHSVKIYNYLDGRFSKTEEVQSVLFFRIAVNNSASGSGQTDVQHCLLIHIYIIVQ